MRENSGQSFSQAAVDALHVTTKRYLVFDQKTDGLAVLVLPTGRKSFVFDYYTRGGQRRRVTIGQVGPWTVKAAQAEARRMRVEIDCGGDPQGERQAERKAATVDELGDIFERDHLPRKRPSTAASYRSILTTIRAELGRAKVVDVSHLDIERLHRKLSAKTPTRANRLVAVLSKMFSLAIKHEIRDSNPCKGIERNTDIKRTRYLTGVELLRLTTALSSDPDQTAVDMVRLLLLTGARRSEVMTATWEQFDLAPGVWTKPATNTKQNKAHRIPLSPPAMQLLAARHQEGATGFVFKTGKGVAYTDIPRAFWRRILAAADLPELRIHDLRHSFASFAASSGASLPIIGALLGHAASATTARYAHLLDDPLRKVATTVGATIAGKPAAEVVAHPRRGRNV